MLLIEVNQKKASFLRTVIATLGLSNIDVYTQDWRTFLRTTHYDVDLFLARASLQPAELMRIFMPSSLYKKATLVYWASDQWQAVASEKKYLNNSIAYTVGNKSRKLIFFKSDK
jgi:16S rRNA G527 N7-methylase RsmG